MGKVSPTPKGRQTICFALDEVLGEELGRDTPLRPDPGIRHGFIGCFLLRAPVKNPITCLNAPVLYFSGICFHLKTFNGALFFPLF